MKKFYRGEKVRIGKGKAVWDVTFATENHVIVSRTIGVGRLGRYGRTTTMSFGPGYRRSIDDLVPVGNV